MQWFDYPNIDPILFAVGPFEIRWYALAYIIGIIGAIYYAKKLVRQEAFWHNKQKRPSSQAIDDFMLWVTLGILFGGRLGYVLFYDFGYFISHPLDIFAIWQGGMAFHGGLLGVFIAILLFAYKRDIPTWSLLDLAAASAPIGLFLGRLANFINGELFGRITNHPIGMIFPHGGDMPRHPSQLYQAAMEGILLFLLLYIAIRYFKALTRPGMVTGLFCIIYGFARIIAEIFREPDAHIGFLAGNITMGMLLSLPMIIVGFWIVRVRRKKVDIGFS